MKRRIFKRAGTCVSELITRLSLFNSIRDGRCYQGLKLRHLEGGGDKPVTAVPGQYISENIAAGREGGMPILRIHASIFTPLKQRGMMFSSSSSTEELKNVFDSSFTALFVKRAFSHSINSVPALPPLSLSNLVSFCRITQTLSRSYRK